MQQLKDFGDDRNRGFCIHCGGPDETKDHIPSKVLLDEPFPENLPVCPSCFSCNNKFSVDEEYLACLLECVLIGETNPSLIRRIKIGKLLEKKPKLLARLQNAKSAGANNPIWDVENDRVKIVILKLARGHIAFELNEPRLDEPNFIDFKPLPSMSEAERETFEADYGHFLQPWPEVGSRSMQRMLIAGSDIHQDGWIEVQEGNYRYATSQYEGLTVKIVLREYLACRVDWD